MLYGIIRTIFLQIGGNIILRGKTLLLLAVGITLGLSVSLFGKKIDINHNDMMKYYLFGALLIIIILISVGLFRVYRLKNVYSTIIPILNTQKDSQRFISELINLVNKAPNFTRNLLEINLAIGYSANGEDDKAYQIITSIDPRNLSEENQAGYYINLFAITYNRGDEIAAISILEENKELLQRYENHPSLSAAISSNMVYRYITEQDFDNAKLYLEKADTLCTIPYIKDTIDYLKAVIMMNDNCLEEARLQLQQLKENKPTPSLRIKIGKLEEMLSLM